MAQWLAYYGGKVAGVFVADDELDARIRVSRVAFGGTVTPYDPSLTMDRVSLPGALAGAYMAAEGFAKDPKADQIVASAQAIIEILEGTTYRSELSDYEADEMVRSAKRLEAAALAYHRIEG